MTTENNAAEELKNQLLDIEDRFNYVIKAYDAVASLVSSSQDISVNSEIFYLVSVLNNQFRTVINDFDKTIRTS